MSEERVIPEYAARYVLADGRVVDLTEKTRPRASKDFPCEWGWHDIRKGDRYVRCTYKVVGEGSIITKHVCLECWCGDEENGE